MTRQSARSAAYLLAIALVLCCAAHAATRTTPVEVFNVPTVKFDPTGNTVKAEQSGTWSVGLDTTANTVKIDSTLNTVKAMQSGTYEVSILGTPTVSFNTSANTVKAEQSGTWSVSLAGTPTVNAQAAYSKVQLFPGENPALAGGESRDTAAIDCRGFTEMRVIVNWNASSAPRIGVSYLGPFTSYYDLGSYVGSVNNVVTDANFTYGGRSIGQGSRTALTFPVVSDYMKVWVQATTTTTFWGGYCFAYLVN